MGSALKLTDEKVLRLCAADALRLKDAHRDSIRRGERSLRQEFGGPNADERLELAAHYHAVGRHAMVKKTLQPLVDGGDVTDVQRARAQARLGWAEFFLGDLGLAEDHLRESILFFQPTAGHSDLAVALRGLGSTLQARGQLKEAMEQLQCALAAATRDANQSEVGRCLSSLGMGHRMGGEYAQAITLHQRCMASCSHEIRGHMVGRAHLNSAVPEYLLGRIGDAQRSATEALNVFQEEDDARGVGLASIILSRVARQRDELDLAHYHADVGLRIAAQLKYPRLEVLALEEIADCHMAEEKPRAAVSTLDKALKIAVKIASKGDLAYEVSWRLARACRAIGQISRARELAESAVRMAAATADVREHALSAHTLALVRNDLGRRDEARQLIEDAIEALRRLDASFDLAQAHETAATFAIDGDRDEARAIAHLHEAIRLYSRCGVGRAADAAEERLRAVEETAGLPPRRELETAGVGTMIAVSQAMRDVVKTAQTLADFDNAVLIEGPTGCGKEIIARLIHSSGAWAKRPFTPLNCAALPMHLLESELFGHRRGAFTGADRDHIGHLEAAGDGIVFLDELDKTNKVFQSKLLRVLEDRRFVPVGETSPRPFRARILCACNRSLRGLSTGDTFLPDLYFRLAASRIEIPALRDRPEDVEALAEAFLDQCAERYGTKRLQVSRDVRVALMAYSWPGNVRELKNVIELAAFYARGEKRLRIGHLPVEVAKTLDGETSDPLSSHIEVVERREIDLAMRKAAGSRTNAAKILGVSRKGLMDRLRRLRIDEW